MIIEGNVITPDAGMILTNGETYSDKVYLGIYDDPSNWHEIPADETEEDVSDEEALQILLGGAT